MQNTTERAKYRILATAGFFGPDDTLYEENQVVFFDGEPNEEMEPLNTLAKSRWIEHVERLDLLGRETAGKLGRPFRARPRTLDGALRIATEVERANVAVMGARKEVTSIEKTEQEVPEVPVRKKGGRPRLAID